MPSTHKVRLRGLLRSLREGNISDIEFHNGIARIVADALKCSRAGVWLFREESGGRAMTCVGMYDRTRGRNTFVPDVHSQDALPLFDALEKVGHVVADDAPTHSTTRLFFERKLTRINVTSLLAAAFSVNGKLYGAFLCTQVDEPRQWTQMELLLLKRLGSSVSLILTEADGLLDTYSEIQNQS